MEAIFLLLCLVILGGWVCLVVIAITLYDIRAIKLEKSLRRCPHARRWRGRPTIAIGFHQLPSLTAMSNLRQGKYRNITTLNRAGRAQLLLYMRGDESLHESALRDANSYLQFNSKTRFVELTPVLPFPRTTRQFFDTYHAIVTAPFIKLRAVMNVCQPKNKWPLLSRKSSGLTWRDKAYIAIKWIVSLTNALLVVYVGSIAIMLGQPEYFVAYMSVFMLWVVWSITDYRHVPLWEKVAYLLLAPASLGYFLWRVFAAPFPLIRPPRLSAVRRRVLS